MTTDPQSNPPQPQITQLLRAAGGGDQVAAAEVFPLIYDELRRLARAHLHNQHDGLTLQPTALVHETYLRLFGEVDADWNSRQHFFNAAARAMRQIVVDHARQKATAKYGGGKGRVTLEKVQPAIQELPPEDIVAIDEALCRLEQLDDRKARVVTLRCFSGLSVEETGDVLGVSAATVKRDWQFSKAWLYQEMVGRQNE